jgi:ABC-2 type transport system ATP-binding protein
VTALLEVRNLTRCFDALTAVDRVSFQVGAGEIWGFIGPNGAGKTTTMRICATLDMPDAGDVLLDGRSVLTHPTETRRRTGFMPDTLGNYASTTVWEYLDFFGRCARLERSEREARIASVLEFTDLADMRERLVPGLSKGMGQRLCLAKTLLHDPDLLILDEPASGLDPRARVDLRRLVRRLAESGKGVLISSHILSELAEICHGVVVIEHGRVVKGGTLAELSTRAAERELIFVRGLAPADQLERALAESPGVLARRPERGGFVIEFAGDAAAISALLADLVARGLQPVEFHWQALDLEELFLAATTGRLQ